MDRNIKTLMAMIGLVIFTSVDSYGMLSAAHKLKPSGCLVPINRFIRYYDTKIIRFTPEDLHRIYPAIYGEHYVKPSEGNMFKSIMDDVHIRSSFLRTFTNLNVIKSKKIDSTMQPVKTYQSLRDSFRRADLANIFKDKQTNILEILLNGKRMERLENFVCDLIRDHYYVRKAISYNPPEGLLNLRCHLSTDDYAIVQVNVDTDCSLDYRTFSRGANAFVQTLENYRSGYRLNRVLIINFIENIDPDYITDDELIYKTIPWFNDDHYRRHYQFVDTENISDHRILNSVDLIQINLSMVSKTDLQRLNTEERDWLLFLRSAHKHNPEFVRKNITTPAVLHAYELCTHSRISDDVYVAIEFDRPSTISQQEKRNIRIISRKEGRKEGIDILIKTRVKAALLNVAKEMVSMGKNIEEIEQVTKLSRKEIQEVMNS